MTVLTKYYPLSDELNELFLKIPVPLENVSSWENDLFLWNLQLAGRKGTDLKFHFTFSPSRLSNQNHKNSLKKTYRTETQYNTELCSQKLDFEITSVSFLPSWEVRNRSTGWEKKK